MVQVSNYKCEMSFSEERENEFGKLPAILNIDLHYPEDPSNKVGDYYRTISRARNFDLET